MTYYTEDGHVRQMPGTVDSDPLVDILNGFFPFVFGPRKVKEFVRVPTFNSPDKEVRARYVTKGKNGSYKRIWGKSRKLTGREREEFLSGVWDERDIVDI